MIGSVFGPMVMSTPTVISGFPARPMPTIRPPEMPMFAFTTPSSGSTTSTPAIRTSSSLAEVAPSCWVIRDRMFLAYPHSGSSPNPT
jgi:hypothetical protein